MSEDKNIADNLLDDAWDREIEVVESARAPLQFVDEQVLAREAVAQGAARVVDIRAAIAAVASDFKRSRIPEIAALRFFFHMADIDMQRRRFVRRVCDRRPLSFAYEMPWAIWWWTNLAVCRLPRSIDRALIWTLVVHGYERRLLLAVRKIPLYIEPSVSQPNPILLNELDHFRRCVGSIRQR